jgi:hypothetical protein
VGASYAACALALFGVTGFALWDCVLHGRAGGIALMTETLGGPPGRHWARFSYGNLAAFAIGSGIPLVGLAAARLRAGSLGADRFTLPALATLAILGAGGLFFLETERIWLFAMPWLAAIAASGARITDGALRLALAVGLAQAFLLEALLFTIW